MGTEDKKPEEAPVILQPKPDNEFLQDVYQRLLWEPNERKAKEVIASLGHAEGSPEAEELLKLWREYRQKVGWQVT